MSTQGIKHLLLAFCLFFYGWLNGCQTSGPSESTRPNSAEQNDQSSTATLHQSYRAASTPILPNQSYQLMLTGQETTFHQVSKIIHQGELPSSSTIEFASWFDEVCKADSKVTAQPVSISAQVAIPPWNPKQPITSFNHRSQSRYFKLW